MKASLITCGVASSPFVPASLLVAEDDDSPIEDHMEAMEKSSKPIKRQVGDPEGTHFDVPANSGFDIEVTAGVCEYVCSFLD